MTFEEAKQQAIDRSEWVLCHDAGYYTARTPDGRDIIGKGENGVFVGGECRRIVVRVHKATESIEVYFGMERNGLISALEVGGDHFEAGLEYYRRTLEAFCTAFGIEVTEYVYNSYCHSFRWRAKNEGDEEITDNEYIRHCLSLFEPTGFYLDDVILGPAKQPTEGKVFGDVIEECLEAFFSACCQDVEYTQSQEYFADFAENNELEFYENGICVRHR